MPTISFFYGIYIKMYFDDHFPPHFHVEYQDFEGSVSIETGEVIDGKIPRNAHVLVEQWRKLHIDELTHAWEDAKHLKNPGKIIPLED